MKWGEENFYLNQEYLSDIELYLTNSISGDNVEFIESEFKHITRVMRHSIGDELHCTDGLGNYYKSIISNIDNDSVSATIKERKKYKNELENIYFCFPRLKSNDRFEFELEKSIELGITNFIIINTERTIPKGEKIERWSKISLAAMKQSLRTYLPKIEYLNSLQKLNSFEGEKIFLDQKGSDSLVNYLRESEKNINKNVFFIFGPEGGLTEKEMGSLENNKTLFLTDNRLRAETAVIVTATTISLI
jgi:16S rRNA (uracil1498-N3)-methyltransferase